MIPRGASGPARSGPGRNGPIPKPDTPFTSLLTSSVIFLRHLSLSALVLLVRLMIIGALALALVSALSVLSSTDRKRVPKRLFRGHVDGHAGGILGKSSGVGLAVGKTGRQSTDRG